MKLKQTAIKASRFFMKGEWRRWQIYLKQNKTKQNRTLSHNDCRGCCKGLKALQSILELLMEITVNTITCNNNYCEHNNM